MLCSVSTPAAAKPTTASPSWLDRLHLAKGFSLPSPDLHLDHFLLPSSNPIPNPPLPPPQTDAGNDHSLPPPSAVSASRRRRKIPSSGSACAEQQQQPRQLVDLMSSVLAELFVMGGRRPALNPKKAARKQPNPRSCIPSASASVDGCRGPRPLATSPPSSADNSVAEAKKARTKKARKKRAAPAGSTGDMDLTAYSRTEVTVIDSSAPCWKSEKIIFRKGLIWKFRDKKTWSLGRKKRRLGLVARLANEEEAEKPLVGLKMSSATNEQDGSLSGGFVDAHKRDDSKETDPHIQISARRKFSRSPRLPAAKSSSVLHMELTTTSKKNGFSVPKVPLKR